MWSSKEETKEEETKSQFNRKQLYFMINKLEYFLSNVNVIYDDYNSKIEGHIKGYKNDLDIIKSKLKNIKIINSLKDELFNLISKIWIRHDINLYKICNIALLMDIYYSVLLCKKPPKFLKIENCDFSYDKFDTKLKVLLRYWAWLWLMLKETSDIREAGSFYRGIGYDSKEEYTLGNKYRFGNYE